MDFLVMGYKGRRKSTEADLLASDVSYMMQYARCSTIIVRDEFTSSEKFHMACAVDANRWSEKALHDALLLTEPGDRLTVLHV